MTEQQHQANFVPDYDVIIIGGGMVGASLACALANQATKRIAVVEAFFGAQQLTAQARPCTCIG